MEGRVVLHSDLNNCYASIECMLHPELRGKYIAVCGSTEDRHGIVLAKNQLAKQCGVKTGEVIWEARQKCPQLTIVEPHMDQYLSGCSVLRVSTMSEMQAESFEIQQQYYNEFIAKHPNWTLVRIYADEGISATSVNNRKPLYFSSRYRISVTAAFENSVLIFLREVI